MEEYSKELTRADIEFLEMPKNAVSTLDFLVSSITKIQKGQRLALGLDEEEFEDNFIDEYDMREIVGDSPSKSLISLDTFKDIITFVERKILSCDFSYHIKTEILVI